MVNTETVAVYYTSRGKIGVGARVTPGTYRSSEPDLL